MKKIKQYKSGWTQISLIKTTAMLYTNTVWYRHTYTHPRIQTCMHAGAQIYTYMYSSMVLNHGTGFTRYIYKNLYMLKNTIYFFSLHMKQTSLPCFSSRSSELRIRTVTVQKWNEHQHNKYTKCRYTIGMHVLVKTSTKHSLPHTHARTHARARMHPVCWDRVDLPDTFKCLGGNQSELIA